MKEWQSLLDVPIVCASSGRLLCEDGIHDAIGFQERARRAVLLVAHQVVKVALQAEAINSATTGAAAVCRHWQRLR